MPKLFALALVTSISFPLISSADDQVAPKVDIAPVVTISPVVTIAPVVNVPAAPPPVATPPVEAPPSDAPPIEAEAPVEDSHCAWQAHGNWHSQWHGKMSGRLALGVSAGHVENDATEGHQKSIIARLNGRRGWALELELSKSTLGDDSARTAGGAIVKAFGQRKLQPYVLASAGGGRVEHADGSEAHIRFAEVGGGLMLKKRHFAIGFDVRRGVRHEEAAETMDAVRMTTPTAEPANDRYVRGRVLALVYF